MKYYQYRWEETRGDQYDHWGFSIWYFEVGEDHYINRQIVIYDHKDHIFKYSQENQEDEYGGLGYEKFNLSEFDDSEECSKSEFDKHWHH